MKRARRIGGEQRSDKAEGRGCTYVGRNWWEDSGGREEQTKVAQHQDMNDVLLQSS